MFRSSTTLRELVQNLAKVIFLSKQSVKLRRCILCGDVAACCEMACVLFVVQTDTLCVCYTQVLSAYRAVNTFHLGYKNQSVYAVSGTSRCLFSDKYKTHKY